MKAKIKAISYELPKKVMTNQDWEKLVDTTDEWIKTRTGIETRYFTDENTAASDLATAVAEKALKQAGMSPEELDLILIATVTADHNFPSTGCIVQANIGAVNAAAMDISAACTGFIYGLDIARNFIMSGKFKNIFVAGAETLTKITDMTDRGTCVLFGDGCGGAIVSATEDDDEQGIVDCYIKSDGRLKDFIIQPGGGSRKPISQKVIDDKDQYIKMQGNTVFKHAVKNMGESVEHILKANNCSYEDVDFFIPHQANKRIIDAIAKRGNLPPEKVIINVNKVGNTSAASIPIAFSQAVEEGKIKRGDLVLVTAFGSGFTWGSSLIRY